MKFLLCTDGSRDSLAILPHAARLAHAIEAEVILARVLDPRVDAASEVSPDLEVAVERVEKQWKAELQADLLAAGLDGEIAVPRRVWGREFSDAIHLAAEEAGASLVAVRSSSSGRVHHAVFGSVALGVLSRAGLPVLTINGSEPLPTRSGQYHIVVTSDGSPDARSVFASIAPLLVPGRVRVTLLQVAALQAGEAEDEAQARALPALEALLARIPAGVEAAGRVDTVVPGQTVAKAILAAVADLEADAIASATHGQSALRHLVAGSTALGLLRSAPIPVILVKSTPVD